MIKRQPELAKYAGGMEPGLTNPLGARALYLFNKGGDTGYRLHGTPEWNSIGKAMSSGCIRLMNQDIIDLYNRVEVGAKVIVHVRALYADRPGNTDVANRKPGTLARFFVVWRSFGCRRRAKASGDLLDLLHFRHEMAQQVLDAVLQRRRRRRAAGAGALHVQEHACRSR